MNPFNLKLKLSELTNEQVFAEIDETILEVLRFNSLKFKPEHSKLVFDNAIGMIRRNCSDFTINDLQGAFKSGGYGEYGDYKDVNAKTIMQWISKKRMELFAKDAQNNYNKNREIPQMYCKDGGKAVMLGMALVKMGINLEFDERLDIVTNNKMVPGLGKKYSDLIDNYLNNIKREGI